MDVMFLLLMLAAVSGVLIWRWRVLLRKTDASGLFVESDMLHAVRRTPLYAVRPVNKEAVRVMYALDEWVASRNPDWRIGFEVSMGAFVKTAGDLGEREQHIAFRAYNSKRVDFLLINRFGYPVLAVEYHGSGHDLSGDAGRRMEMKRLVCKQAGIPLVEIAAHTSKKDMMQLLDEKTASFPGYEKE
jgi:hypothetical protein